MACFPGSSGSPVVVYETMYLDRRLNGSVSASRGFLLGVAFGTQPKSVDGKKQVISEIPLEWEQIPESLHITYYWKASLIHDLLDEKLRIENLTAKNLLAVEKSVVS